MATENKDDIIIAMLEEIKSGMKNQNQSQIDLSKVEQLSGTWKRVVSNSVLSNDTTLSLVF